ncbi:MAG: hypothetical protein HKM94_05195 [Halobacteria archaeon]|nr:hypothetical protein [Halobacteria archaeon]
MIDSQIDTNNSSDDQSSMQAKPKDADTKRKKSISMHDGIAVWCDCCSCEAEPYWAELAEEMGVDLGSDYEESDS